MMPHTSPCVYIHSFIYFYHVFLLQIGILFFLLTCKILSSSNVLHEEKFLFIYLFLLLNIANALLQYYWFIILTLPTPSPGKYYGGPLHRIPSPSYLQILILERNQLLIYFWT